MAPVDRIVVIDPADCGPKNAREGDTMQAQYGAYAAEYTLRNGAWVKTAETDHRGQWPNTTWRGRGGQP